MGVKVSWGVSLVWGGGGGCVCGGKNKSEVKKKEKSSHISLIQKRIRFADLRHMFPQSRLRLCDDGDCGGDGEELETKKHKTNQHM